MFTIFLRKIHMNTIFYYINVSLNEVCFSTQVAVLLNTLYFVFPTSQSEAHEFHLKVTNTSSYSYNL